MSYAKGLARLQELDRRGKVFVAGAPKSGTTWMQRLLDAHPDVVCSGEGHYVTRIGRRFAELVRSYNRELGIEAEQVYQGAPYYRAIAQEEFDLLLRLTCLTVLGQRHAGEAVIGDKTPRYAESLPQLTRVFPEALIVHVVRDPRDVAVSRLHHAHRAGYPEALTAGSERRRELLDNAISAWVSVVARARVFAERAPDRLVELRYEDLLADAAGRIGPVFRRLGVAADAATCAAAVDAASFRRASGRRPGEEAPESFLRKGVAGDWTTALDPQEAARVADGCRTEMERHGYA